MGLSAKQHPPIRTQRFQAAFLEAGYRPFQRDQDATARYAHALGFLDHLIERAPDFELHLRHRLDAQGIVWCIGGGWKGYAEFGNVTVEEREDGPDDAEAASLVERAARGRTLSETERRALVLSRRGQGQFRDDLIGVWGRCAVTGCRDTRLLRASHLKPWRQSTNTERLDPFNGVLLAPHLDIALDCGLITFTDDGSIRLSSTLSSADSKCLGIRRAMKLRYVDGQHRPYLRYHRTNVFRK